MELGSDFDLNMLGLEISENSFFEYMGDIEFRLFNSGRSALKAVSRTLSDGNILMPEYICKSVLDCFPADRTVFYRLDKSLHIDTEDLRRKLNGGTSAVFLMHYFGVLQPESAIRFLLEAKERYGFIIIEDTTHSIFSEKQTAGDYCIASLRKWLPLPGGGVLYAGNSASLCSYDEVKKSTDDSRAYAMMLKALYLNGRLDRNHEYRKIFAECEERLDAQKEIRRISDFSEFLLRCFDVCDAIRKRRRNLNYLKDRLGGIGVKQICDFSERDCPLTLPILVPERDGLRGHLAESRVYCAVHWPFDGRARGESPLGAALAENMLSLPIDQRYGEAEMEYLFQVIKAYKGRLIF